MRCLAASCGCWCVAVPVALAGKFGVFFVFLGLQAAFGAAALLLAIWRNQ